LSQIVSGLRSQFWNVASQLWVSLLVLDIVGLDDLVRLISVVSAATAAAAAANNRFRTSHADNFHPQYAMREAG
jgi:hypothetical protein